MEYTVHYVLGITIILNPTLVNSIDHFLAAARDPLEHKVDVLQGIRGAL